MEWIKVNLDTAVGSPLEDGTTTYGMNTGTGVLFKTVSISPTWVQQNNSVALTFVPDIQIERNGELSPLTP